MYFGPPWRDIGSLQAAYLNGTAAVWKCRNSWPGWIRKAETVALSMCVCVPLGSLQVIVGLFQLPDIFVQLLLYAACLDQVVLQHRDLLIALSVLLLQFLLQSETRGSHRVRHDTSQYNIKASVRPKLLLNHF